MIVVIVKMLCVLQLLQMLQMLWESDVEVADALTR